nr:MAG TPA: holin [Siphoviridae sp. ctgbm9]
MKRVKDLFYCLSNSMLLFLMTQIVIGCTATPKVVTRQTYISDKQSHWDSIFNTRLLTTLELYQSKQSELKETSKSETNHIRDSTSVTVDKEGNIIRKDKYHYESHNYSESFVQKLRDSVSYYKSYKDSLSKYRLKIDSLNKAKQDSVPYPVYIEKPMNKTDATLLRLGKVTAVFVPLFMIGMISWQYIKRRKKYKFF